MTTKYEISKKIFPMRIYKIGFWENEINYLICLYEGRLYELRIATATYRPQINSNFVQDLPTLPKDFADNILLYLQATTAIQDIRDDIMAGKIVIDDDGFLTLEDAYGLDGFLGKGAIVRQFHYIYEIMLFTEEREGYWVGFQYSDSEFANWAEEQNFSEIIDIEDHPIIFYEDYPSSLTRKDLIFAIREK